MKITTIIDGSIDTKQNPRTMIPPGVLWVEGGLLGAMFYIGFLMRFAKKIVAAEQKQ